ncbi:hypothetical protein GA0070214_103328 [Micromonospora chaiyaphumensis]|uniref:Uncharacterized protein n=1 Tax=Micromonospora chaiyaphumensis TaxID=307119 RepID=A0A1C4W8C6_9ACTN|nr:hypothetical protein GA0070214_103328 [Micromonospora chaiyaphumensis]
MGSHRAFSAWRSGGTSTADPPLRYLQVKQTAAAIELDCPSSIDNGSTRVWYVRRRLDLWGYDVPPLLDDWVDPFWDAEAGA